MAFAADDRVFLGEGLFETLKVEQGKPCRAYLHWQRLVNSAQLLSIPITLSYKEWLTLLQQKIDQDNLLQGGIKAILSGGSAPRGLAARGQRSELLLQTFSFIQQLRPLHIVQVPWLRDAANPVYQVKSINYLEAILARRQAITLGADDALFFNLQHHATETTCANFFLIHQNTLFTPPLIDGVLPGITRARIIALAKQHKINCLEVSVTQTMIAQAQAIFVTNALQGIQKVGSLNGQNFAIEHPLMERLICSLHAESEI